MKKKGFTLVELLAVIVILGLLGTMATVSVIYVSKRLRTNMYCSKIETIEKAAELYGQDLNESEMNISCTHGGNSYNVCTTISVETLLNERYLDEDSDGDIIDPRDKTTSMKNNELYIYKKNNRIYASFIYNTGEEDICN